MKTNIYNALSFNVAWLVCVLGGSMVALAATIVVIAIHMVFVSKKPPELALIAVVILLGVVVDSLFIRSGLLVSPDGGLWPPLWLVCLWGLFSTMLNHSLKWFQTHLAMAAVVGGVSGTLSYLGGTRLSDFTLREPQFLPLVVMFVVWFCVFPFCLKLASTLFAESGKNLQAG